MDTLNLFGTDYLDDSSWLDTSSMPEMPDLSPEDEAMVALVQKAAQKLVAEKANIRASRRKKEEPASSPSQKITIRLPKPLLDLLRKQAAKYGMPYQTFIRTILHDAVRRSPIEGLPRLGVCP